MTKKIPTQADIKERQRKREEERQKANEERVLRFLQDKALGFYFHTALAVEKHDVLVPTKAYNKAFKRDGNRVLKHMEKVINENFERLYSDDPEFTTNMFAKIERAIDLMAMVEFADYPVLVELLEEFHNNKDAWRANVISKFNILDADLKPRINNEEKEHKEPR